MCMARHVMYGTVLIPWELQTNVASILEVACRQSSHDCVA
jgi:hypothetical protein